jgi:hypothetical protein
VIKNNTNKRGWSSGAIPNKNKKSPKPIFEFNIFVLRSLRYENVIKPKYWARPIKRFIDV